MARRALTDACLAVVQAVRALPAAPWAVACSGGADSLALAWAAAHVASRRGTPCRAVVVDHGLQPGSDAVAAGVAARLAALPDPGGRAGGTLSLPAAVVRVSVPDAGDGPEASARRARYAALEAASAGRGAPEGERVLLGHTRSDQAETVLLGLARGSGTRSLAGMPAERGVFVRPLLGLDRAVTAAACADLGLTPWTDPHNAERRFARVRVRESVLPLLEAELGPGVAQALVRTAALARADADLLDSLAAGVLAAAPRREASDRGPIPAELDAAWLAGLPPALRDRALRAWLAERGCAEASFGHVAVVAALVTGWHGQKGADVPGARVVRRNGWLGTRPDAGADDYDASRGRC